jgi:hypothetical protein
MAETLPGFESDNWYAFFVPAGTSKEIVAKLNSEILKALKSPEVIDYMVKDGADPAGSTPEALAATFQARSREVRKADQSCRHQGRMIAAGGTELTRWLNSTRHSSITRLSTSS